MNYIYFDFDGTIADSIELNVEIFNILSLKYGFKKVDIEKTDYYRTLNSQEILREFNIPFFKIPFIVADYKKEVQKRLNQLSPIEKIPDIVEILAKKYFLGILTSNSTKNVNYFLSMHNLSKYFSDVRSERKLLQKDKALKKIIKYHGIKSQQIVYVGDETRDIVAASKVHIKNIGVTWGLNSKKALIDKSAYKIADTPSEIPEIIEKCFSEDSENVKIADS